MTQFLLSSTRRATWVVVFTAFALFAFGCSNAGQGAVSGAGIGALSGLAIGSLTGEAGKGAAIGAIAGGVGGAIIGDQNRRRDEAAEKNMTSAATMSSGPAAYSTGQPLGNLVGDWNVRETLANGKSPGQGTAHIIAEKNYFVRLELRFKNPNTSETVEGTSVISQTGGRGVEMTNSFSSNPQVRRFKGEMDSSGTVFTLTEVGAISTSPRKIILRVPGRNGFSADVWDGSQRVESYSFTPASASALVEPSR
jgi:hypothetical protein